MRSFYEIKYIVNIKITRTKGKVLLTKSISQ